MRASRLVSLALALAGALALAYAAWQGELAVHLVVVIPVVTSSSPWAVLGVLLLFLGVVAWLLTGAATPPRQGPDRGPPPTKPQQAQATTAAGPEQERKSGGVILIGPIPIAWGSDPDTLGWVLALAIVLILVAAGALLLLS